MKLCHYHPFLSVVKSTISVFFYLTASVEKKNVFFVSNLYPILSHFCVKYYNVVYISNHYNNYAV